MNKSAAALTLTLLVRLLTLALTGVAGAAKQDVDFTKGKGVRFSSSSSGFSFEVKDLDTDPTTDAAEGKFTYKGTPSIKGKVACLRVDGQNAYFSGKIEKSNAPFWEGKIFIVKVTDSGQQGGDGDLLDITYVATSEPPSCSTPTGGSQRIEKGNIVVKDAP